VRVYWTVLNIWINTWYFWSNTHMCVLLILFPCLLASTCDRNNMSTKSIHGPRLCARIHAPRRARSRDALCTSNVQAPSASWGVRGLLPSRYRKKNNLWLPRPRLLQLGSSWFTAVGDGRRVGGCPSLDVRTCTIEVVASPVTPLMAYRQYPGHP
jgi:hypothetical protein